MTWLGAGVLLLSLTLGVFYRRRLNRWLKALLLLGALLGALGATALLWLPWLAERLAVSDEVAAADAIIVLSGEAGERVTYAVRLYQAGYAPWLLMSGGPVEWRVPAASIMREQAESLGVAGGAIYTENEATSTRENALYSRALVTELGWRRLIVVSSPYHLRRTRLAFDRVFAGTGVSLSYVAAQPSWFDPGNWWRSREGIEVVALEYLKLLWYHLAPG